MAAHRDREDVAGVGSPQVLVASASLRQRRGVDGSAADDRRIPPPPPLGKVVNRAREDPG
jgi:hypothetical protein